MTFNKVTHCIFDLDGTIFDTEKVYFKSIDGVLRQFGKQHSLELCRKIIGRTRQDYSRIIVEDARLPITPQEFLERMDVISHSMFLDSILLPGAKKLILHLRKHGIPAAVGTSSNLASVDLKFTHHRDLEACFSHIVSGTDDPEVLQGKPAPDVFLVAARRFNPAPEPRTCLVFEDAPNGVRAGLSAGMQVVMIPDPKVVTAEQRMEPTICLKSLADFQPELFGLPPFEKETPLFKPVTHCIFDLDGTIFDTEKVYFKSIDGVLQQFGKRHTLELCRKIIGRTRQDYSKIIVEDARLPITPQEFLERMDVISHSMFLNSVLLPGAKELIHHLHKHGIPAAVGTSSNLASVDLKFTHHKDLESWFNHVVSGTDDPEVLAGKPAPDVFLVAARRFNPAPKPENCLVFEDAPNGVRAGLAAGMQVVMIPDPNVVTDEQRREPTVCLKSLSDFKPEWFGLPAFSSAPAQGSPVRAAVPKRQRELSPTSTSVSAKLRSDEGLMSEA